MENQNGNYYAEGTINEENTTNEVEITIENVTHSNENNINPNKTKKNIIKNNSVVFVMAILFALTIGFAVGNMKKDEVDTSNVTKNATENDIYSNIIKTFAGSSTNGELSIKEIAKLTENSVVEITTESVVRGSMLGQFVYEGAGSGVVIAEDGYIVTNNHVIESASKIMIKLKNEEVYEANVVGRSTESDIAILKIDAKGLQPAVLGDSSKLVVGDTAVVVGNPLGSGATVTNGIISAMDREIDLGDTVMNLLQTNAAVNPGNSGGGLFNGKGELVGIVVAKSKGSDIEGIGFAIPINDIKDTIYEIKTYGYIRGRVMLGVNLLEITNTWDAMIYKLDSLGVYVRSVEEGSDAARAGIKSGDRIISINGKDVETADDIKKEISASSPGDKIILGISRNGREYNVNVILSEYKGE